MFFSKFQHIYNNSNSAIKVSKFWLFNKFLNFFAYHQATARVAPEVRVLPSEKYWIKGYDHHRKIRDANSSTMFSVTLWELRLFPTLFEI
jgi:hypothetical protein